MRLWRDWGNKGTDGLVEGPTLILATRGRGEWETRRMGDKENGSKENGRQGEWEIGRMGNKENGRQGENQIRKAQGEMRKT